MKNVKKAFPDILKKHEDNLVSVTVYSEADLDEPIFKEELEEYGILLGGDDKIVNVDVASLFTIKNGDYMFDKTTFVFMNAYSEGWYSEENLGDGSPVCVPSHEYCFLNDKNWSLNGIEYEVVGTGNTVEEGYGPFVNVFIIPLESVSDSSRLENIIIEFKEPIVRSEFETLKELFEEALDYKVEFNDFCSISLDEVQTMKTMILVSILMALVASFIICLIYRNILEKRVYTTGIYQICGCTRLRAAMIYIVEIFILLSVSTIAGSVLYLKTIMPALEPYFNYFSDIYSKNITYILPLVYLGVVLMVSAIMIGFKMRKTPKEIMTDLNC